VYASWSGATRSRCTASCSCSKKDDNFWAVAEWFELSLKAVTAAQRACVMLDASAPMLTVNLILLPTVIRVITVHISSYMGPTVLSLPRRLQLYPPQQASQLEQHVRQDAFLRQCLRVGKLRAVQHCRCWGVHINVCVPRVEFGSIIAQTTS
jgi:hypothetical protein